MYKNIHKQRCTCVNTPMIKCIYTHSANTYMQEQQTIYKQHKQYKQGPYNTHTYIYIHDFTDPTM